MSMTSEIPLNTGLHACELGANIQDLVRVDLTVD